MSRSAVRQYAPLDAPRKVRGGVSLSIASSDRRRRRRGSGGLRRQGPDEGGRDARPGPEGQGEGGVVDPVQRPVVARIGIGADEDGGLRRGRRSLPPRRPRRPRRRDAERSVHGHRGTLGRVLRGLAREGRGSARPGLSVRHVRGFAGGRGLSNGVVDGTERPASGPGVEGTPAAEGRVRPRDRDRGRARGESRRMDVVPSRSGGHDGHAREGHSGTVGVVQLPPRDAPVPHARGAVSREDQERGRPQGARCVHCQVRRRQGGRAKLPRHARGRVGLLVHDRPERPVRIRGGRDVLRVDPIVRGLRRRGRSRPPGAQRRRGGRRGVPGDDPSRRIARDQRDEVHHPPVPVPASESEREGEGARERGVGAARGEGPAAAEEEVDGGRGSVVLGSAETPVRREDEAQWRVRQERALQ
mmetsp:Transcript_35862/g.107060  ORF Transcript_35862/g.107060 Transcript_35862/m.107060 type:complete len:415 (-) Transcript_35862:398-1642(-)